VWAGLLKQRDPKQPSGSFVSLLAVVLALSPAGSYLTPFPRCWSGLWADASASFLVVSSLESPFDFSGFPRHSSDNHLGSLAHPIPLAVFSVPAPGKLSELSAAASRNLFLIIFARGIYQYTAYGAHVKRVRPNIKLEFMGGIIFQM